MNQNPGNSSIKSLEKPQPDWLPLRVGVLEFQYSPNRPDVSSGDLVQHLCNQAAQSFDGLEINYHPDEQIFEVESSGSGSDPRSKIFKLADVTTRSGLMRLQDLGSIPWLSAVQGAILTRLENSIKFQVARRRVTLFARLHTPLSENFCEVPSDVLDHFSIVDWRLGIAVGPNNESIYSIHLEKTASEAKDAPTLSLREQLRAQSRRLRKAKFALFLLDIHNGVRPTNRTWDETAQEFLNHINESKGKIDRKTMQEGVTLADAVLREEAGIPQ